MEFSFEYVFGLRVVLVIMPIILNKTVINISDENSKSLDNGEAASVGENQTPDVSLLQS